MTMNQTGFSSEQLNSALLELDDLFTRVGLVNIYLLIGQTGRAVKDGADLSGDRLEVSIPAKTVTPEVKSNLKIYAPGLVETDKGFGFTVNGIPVDVRVIQRNYKFFQYPEPIIYKYEDYQLPNPFEGYWKSRHLVR